MIMKSETENCMQYQFPPIMGILLPNKRSARALVYRVLYRDPRWRKRSREFLARHRFCEWCGKPSRVADHIRPHRGDPDEFFNGDLQALCHKCHSSVKQKVENAMTPKPSKVDLDGWPVKRK